MSEEKKYKATLNLPKTAFAMKANLSQREPEILQSWEKEGLFQAIRRQAAGRPKYILHDGPPYANGHIHIGHALNKILKDIIVRYKTMQGFDAYYVPGWDCHGLPIELQALKELGKKKDEVDPVAFRRQARDYAGRFMAIQKKEFQRLGIYGDWDNAYYTMNYDYQAGTAKYFLDLFEKGFIEQRLKPVPWDYESETALADAELEYAEKTSRSVFVKFPVISNGTGGSPASVFEGKNASVFFLVWTTTPWTLPANVGIAVHAELNYAAVEAGKEIYILAESLVERVAAKAGLADLKILGRFKGQELASSGTAYRHPFLEREGKVITADYVSAEDGTGIVHIAPGHGEEDYVYGHLKNGLPILCPVDEKGRFTEEFPLCKGMNVFKANEPIADMLKEKNLLLHQEDYQHSYPYSSRGHVPIIFRATRQWFLKMDHDGLRSRVLNFISNEVKFHPEWGRNRFAAMVETRPDWCLSRQRFWGVPIPVISSRSTGEALVSQSKEKIVELFRQKGADVWYEEKASAFLDPAAAARFPEEDLKKELDILDVWFDSGVSHECVLSARRELGFPADLYLEGSDQHRGWFQVSLITSAALKNSSPFRSILTHGFVVDGQGKKMSKSKGNVISPEQVVSRMGADVLRLWVSSCDYQFDVRLSQEILDRMVEAYRRIRNTFRYLLGNCGDFDPARDSVETDRMEPIDQWAVGKLALLARRVTGFYDAFEFYHIYREIHDFCTVDMSNFYLDVLKDRMYCDPRAGGTRRSAQTAFYLILKTLTRLLAPILPFTCEEVWRALDAEVETPSIHLAQWPSLDPGLASREAFQTWEVLCGVRNAVNSEVEKLREAGKVGSSLEAAVTLSTADEALFGLLERSHEYLPLAFIVSEVKVEKQAAGGSGSYVAAMEGGREARFDCLVQEAEGAKCERCWNYRKNIGRHEAHPTLCERCTRAVEESVTA